MRSRRQKGIAVASARNVSPVRLGPASVDGPLPSSSLMVLRERLVCAYCKEELSSPPMLMGRNCHHAICSSCKEGFFPTGQNALKSGEPGWQTTCPVCDSPVERIDRPDDGKKYFEVIQSTEAVVSYFDDLLAAAKQFETREVPDDGVGEQHTPRVQQAKSEQERPEAAVSRKRAVSAKKAAKKPESKTPTSSERAMPPQARLFPQPTPQRTKEKRNAKGETPLHAAVIKNKIADVKKYLAAGASPNVQDYAGWTPLHEACSHGFVEMATILLEAGAKVNVPGGELNETPLHDAVSGRRLEIVSLLVTFGADPNLPNSAGVSSMDMAASDQRLTKTLKSSARSDKQRKSAETVAAPAVFEPVLAYCSLASDKVKNMLKVAKDNRWKKPTDDVVRETNYLVTECEESHGVRKAPLNCHTLKACIMGKCIVDYKWLTLQDPESPDSTPTVESVDPWLISEILGIPETREGVKRALENDANMLPPLLDGFQIYVGGPAEFERDDCLGLSKVDFTKVLAAGGATILHREPDPAKLDVGPTKVPFHAVGGPLASTSHLILYPKSKKPNICYNMAELKALPVAWMVDCIAEFRILDPAPFVAST